MFDKEFHYRWEWHLKSSPHALWPFFADTNRVNRDTGIFPVEEVPADKVNARRLIRYRLPVPVIWEEEPFEWTYPHRYGVFRRYLKGPFLYWRVLVLLEPLPGGGTKLVYQTWIKSRNIIGLMAIPIGFGLVAPRRLQKASAKYDAIASLTTEPFVPAQKYVMSAGARRRLEAIRQQLIDQNLDAHLVDGLLDMISTADDLTLTRLRPYVFADQWGRSRRDVLELFLWATRVGLLDFQWEVLCPLCRGAEDRVSGHLEELESHAHCNSCNIDFRANFEHSVELTFTPNPAIRPVERLQFCIAGPQVTPHVVVQQLLDSFDERIVRPVLEAGRYRLRTLGLPGGQHFQVKAAGLPEARLTATMDGWPSDSLEIGPSPSLSLYNETDMEQLFVLERMAWSDQATTASEVTTLQCFRDLFSDEALRPGEQIGVGSLTILFTDLVDSTRMYREIGDATAFGLVMNHFDVLRETILAEEGAIVKTIGDAVMAVFRQPLSALCVMARAQHILANPPEGKRPLYLKASIHTGPSIAVTLNERLDYFGSTINVAARLEKFSRGQDIIISQATYADPEVCDFLNNPQNGFIAESFTAQLKGFDEETFTLWRVSMNNNQ